MKMMISLRKTDWDTLRSVASVECRTMREQAGKFVEDALKGAFKVYPKASKLFKVQIVTDLGFTVPGSTSAPEPEDAYFVRANVIGFSRLKRHPEVSYIHMVSDFPEGRVFYTLESLEDLTARFEAEGDGS